MSIEHVIKHLPPGIDFIGRTRILRSRSEWRILSPAGVLVAITYSEKDADIVKAALDNPKESK